MLLPLSWLSATCHGTSPNEASDPPTILLGSDPFPDILFSAIWRLLLLKLSAQGLHVPPAVVAHALVKEILNARMIISHSKSNKKKAYLPHKVWLIEKKRPVASSWPLNCDETVRWLKEKYTYISLIKVRGLKNNCTFCNCSWLLCQFIGSINVAVNDFFRINWTLWG